VINNRIYYSEVYALMLFFSNLSFQNLLQTSLFRYLTNSTNQGI